MTPSQRAKVHALVDEILDVLASNEVPEAAPSKPRRKRVAAPGPTQSVDELTRRRARRVLSDRGWSP